MTVCLFMTYGMTLTKWQEAGLLDREVLLYEELVRRGVRVAIFTYGGPEELAFGSRLPGVEILPAYGNAGPPRSKLAAFMQSLALPWKKRASLAPYRVYKTNQMWGAWVPMIAALLNRAKLIVRCGYEHHWTTVRQGKPLWKRGPIYLLSLLSYRYAHRIIVTTQEIADYVHRVFGVPVERIAISPNVMDTEKFSPAPSESDGRILFVGRLSPEKNLFALVEAAHLSRVGLDLVGQGDLQKALQAHAARLGSDTRFLGMVPNQNLPALIRRSSAFALTSIYEGNPKTLLEAMSCGQAVIGTDVPGIRTLIENGITGLLCPIEAPGIAQAIQLLMNNAELRQTLGRNARQYVLENCSLAKIADRELSNYEKVFV